MEKNVFEVNYNQMVKRIDILKRHFDFRPGLSGLTSLQSDKVRGLLLLCHAEFEDYVENLAMLLIKDANSQWNSTHKANYVLSSLLAYSQDIPKMKTTETKVGKIISDYKNEVTNNNHGIKEKNIKNLFEPLGYSIDDFDNTFISTLNTFGCDRGAIAHLSGRTTMMYDKKTEFSRIDNIVSSFYDFQNVLLSKAN